MYEIKEDYVPNMSPEKYRHSSELTEKAYQWLVYDRAYRIHLEWPDRPVIDLGCGDGAKLARFSRAVGIDIDVRAARLRRANQRDLSRYWIERDLETIDPNEIDVDGAIVICADVIEHLRRPDNLLRLLSRCYKRSLALIVSTPDRDLLHGVDHCGPPVNRTHVREWNLEEFAELMRVEVASHNYGGFQYALERCSLEDKRPSTIVATYRHDRF